jgi:hypothetical protein
MPRLQFRKVPIASIGSAYVLKVHDAACLHQPLQAIHVGTGARRAQATQLTPECLTRCLAGQTFHNITLSTWLQRMQNKHNLQVLRDICYNCVAIVSSLQTIVLQRNQYLESQIYLPQERYNVLREECASLQE